MPGRILKVSDQGNAYRIELDDKRGQVWAPQDTDKFVRAVATTCQTAESVKESSTSKVNAIVERREKVLSTSEKKKLCETKKKRSNDVPRRFKVGDIVQANIGEWVYQYCTTHCAMNSVADHQKILLSLGR